MLKMFENKELRNTYGPTQPARTLAQVHNEKLVLITNTINMLK